MKTFHRTTKETRRVLVLGRAKVLTRGGVIGNRAEQDGRLYFGM